MSMGTSTGSINAQRTVAELVTERPARIRLFERLGIDFCCGGRKTLAQACEEKGLDVHTVVETLKAVEEADRTAPDGGGAGEVGAGRDSGAGRAGMTDWTKASLAELCDHIVATHHQYLYEELPRLGALMDKVVSVHGERHPSLHEVQEIFNGLADELTSHLMKEERFLFPAIRQLEAANRSADGAADEVGDRATDGAADGAADDGTADRVAAQAVRLPFGSVANPIRVMEMEHDSAGDALARMRKLTDGYTPPADACNGYRALLAGLAELEQDLHLHIHKENNILFPRAIAVEERV